MLNLTRRHLALFLAAGLTATWPAALQAQTLEDLKGLADDIRKDLEKLDADDAGDRNATGASEDTNSPAPPAASAAPDSAPIPLPTSATGYAFDADAGRVEFDSSSSVRDLEAFYSRKMTALGWKEHRTVINNDRMVSVRYAKDDKDIMITIMRFGQAVKVTADGSGIAPDDQPSSESTSSETETRNEELTLDEESAAGLPVPKPHSFKGHERSKFRVEAQASVPAQIDAVLAFYRRELANLKWTEDAAKADVNADSAKALFQSPDGPAVLKLGRANGETTISLLVRHEKEAKESGLMPTAGKVKILLGNIFEEPATISFDGGKPIKVAAGVGAKNPDGPSLELAPGKHSFSVKSKGKPAKTDTFEVGADEIWGVLVGPNGGLALPMY